MTTPHATYRLQLHQDFPLAAAESLIPYLDRLGIDTLYLSPIFQARKGSPHGYDVTDPTTVNAELGGQAALDRLFETLRAHHMGAILDIVPNHMAADHDNRWWWDVLARGQDSPFASFFDIDWDRHRGHHQLVLPFLGQPFVTELESGAMRVALGDVGFYLTYYDKEFPLTAPSWRPILARALCFLDPQTQKGARRALYRLWRHLAEGHEVTPRDSLNTWLNRYPTAKEAIHQALTHWNGTPGQKDSWNPLEKLLRAQPWRLAHFLVASREGNYRRFFDINDLPAVRVEQDSVFDRAHSTLIALCNNAVVYGLRIDHIDGLYDPSSYLSTLSLRLKKAPSKDFLLVEKILGADESLPARWPVAGTTGYDFLNTTMQVLLDSDGLVQLTALYAAWEDPKDAAVSVDAGKRQALTELFGSELDRLCREVYPMAAGDRWGHDLTELEIRRAIGALTVSLPIYRTYRSHDTYSSWDQNILKKAFKRAIDQEKGLPPQAWVFLYHVFFSDTDRTLTAKEHQMRRDWVMHWQQLTGPVHAKGFEDTALYRYHRLVCLNEVGGDLDSPGLTPDAFHRMLIDRQATHPNALNATSTHDTKRSEDVRARIGILSEIPLQWKTAVEDWQERIAERVGSLTVPDLSTEYLFFQTLVGALPLNRDERPAFSERLKSYMQKAVREAKVHTGWVHPNLAYENALFSFIDTLFVHAEIVDRMERFIRPVAYYGALSSLSQVLLKTLAPGVPDFYQGSELWDLSLTDPDNRRPVDYTERQRLLDTITTSRPSPQDLLEHWEDGRIKLYVTSRTLDVRRRNARLFQHGAYETLVSEGPQSDHVLAFARHDEHQWCLVVVPLRYARLTWPSASHNIWHSTTLILPKEAPNVWQDALSGQSLFAEAGELPLEAIFSPFPMAILTSKEVSS